MAWENYSAVVAAVVVAVAHLGFEDLASNIWLRRFGFEDLASKIYLRRFIFEDLSSKIYLRRFVHQGRSPSGTQPTGTQPIKDAAQNLIFFLQKLSEWACLAGEMFADPPRRFSTTPYPPKSHMAKKMFFAIFSYIFLYIPYYPLTPIPI